ncbi:hypothetical protein BD408DRAFT_437811 [Parasitella parasitica]|nr:hypothetical protein BD408DRAFT_437811 [Parasitella parasitica]
MDTSLQALDMNQFPVILQQIQQQLTLVTEKVNKHEDLLQRLAVLEQENKDLKKILQDKDYEIQKLQGQVLNHVSAMPTSHPTATPTSSKPATKTSHGSTAGAPSFSQVATAAAHKPTTDKKNDRKRLAAGRVFTSTASKGEQGYHYVYIGRSRKIQRSEVRTHLKSAQVDLGRVLDICFPASQVIGVLLHVQYIQEFTELIKVAKGELYTDFDPLNPDNIADPKYASLSDNERHALIHQFTEARCLQTLSFLRPLNVSGVGKYFVEEGCWNDSADLSCAVAAAMDRLAEKEPKKAAFTFRRKLDHGKPVASDIPDVISHVLSTHVLFVTETWLTSGSYPIDWSQFHLYGSKVPGAFNRGSGGVSALVSPFCPFPVSQLPSYNPHTLSLKGALDSQLSASDSRLGPLTGDSISNARGNALKPWFDEHSLSVLNASLAFGVNTYSAFRGGNEMRPVSDKYWRVCFLGCSAGG